MLLSAVESSHLGRLDYASLSTQALMEILIEGIENRELICGSTEEPVDIEQWEGLEYVQEQPVDAAEKRFNVDWSYFNLVGTIDLRWLPPTAISLDVYDNKLSGSMDLTVLPLSVEWLILERNAFSGEIDLRHLPTKIQHLNVSYNQLSGSLELGKLPNSMQEFHLGANRFSGTVCLRHLPRSLQVLSVNENELSGPVDLTRLPVSIERLWLNKNYFEGKADFRQLPESIQELNISYTNISGEIAVGNRRTRFFVEHSKVQLIR